MTQEEDFSLRDLIHALNSSSPSLLRSGFEKLLEQLEKPGENEENPFLLTKSSSQETDEVPSVLSDYIKISSDFSELLSIWSEEYLKDRKLILLHHQVLLHLILECQIHQHYDRLSQLAITILTTKSEFIYQELTWFDKPDIQSHLFYLFECILAHAIIKHRQVQLIQHRPIPRQYRCLVSLFVKEVDFQHKSLIKYEIKLRNQALDRKLRQSYFNVLMRLLDFNDRSIQQFLLSNDTFLNAVFAHLKYIQPAYDEDEGDDHEDQKKIAARILLRLEELILSPTISLKIKYRLFDHDSIIFRHLLEGLKLYRSTPSLIQVLVKFLRQVLFNPATTFLKHSQTLSTIKQQEEEDEGDDENLRDKSAIKIFKRLLYQLSPTSNLDHQKLVLEMLTIAPEILNDYFNKSNLSFDIRLSFKWFCTMSTLIKFMSLSNASSLNRHFEHLILNDIDFLPAIEFSIGTKHLSKKDISKGLLHPNGLIVHTSCNYLICVCRRMLEHNLYLKFSSQQHQLQYEQQYLQRILPSFETLITLATKHLHKPQQFEVLLCHQLLELLNLYFLCVPKTIEQMRFDPFKLLPSVRLSALPESLQNQVIRVCLSLPASRFQQLTKSNKTFGVELLELYRQTRTKHLRSNCRALIKRMFKRSGVMEDQNIAFASTSKSMDLWIEAMQDPLHAEFIDVLFRKIATDPFQSHLHLSPEEQPCAFGPFTLTAFHLLEQQKQEQTQLSRALFQTKFSPAQLDQIASFLQQVFDRMLLQTTRPVMFTQYYHSLQQRYREEATCTEEKVMKKRKTREIDVFCHQTRGLTLKSELQKTFKKILKTEEDEGFDGIYQLIETQNQTIFELQTLHTSDKRIVKAFLNHFPSSLLLKMLWISLSAPGSSCGSHIQHLFERKLQTGNISAVESLKLAHELANYLYYTQQHAPDRTRTQVLGRLLIECSFVCLPLPSTRKALLEFLSQHPIFQGKQAIEWISWTIFCWAGYFQDPFSCLRLPGFDFKVKMLMLKDWIEPLVLLNYFREHWKEQAKFSQGLIQSIALSRNLQAKEVEKCCQVWIEHVLPQQAIDVSFRINGLYNLLAQYQTSSKLQPISNLHKCFQTLMAEEDCLYDHSNAHKCIEILISCSSKQDFIHFLKCGPKMPDDVWIKWTSIWYFCLTFPSQSVQDQVLSLLSSKYVHAVVSCASAEAEFSLQQQQILTRLLTHCPDVLKQLQLPALVTSFHYQVVHFILTKLKPTGIENFVNTNIKKLLQLEKKQQLAKPNLQMLVLLLEHSSHQHQIPKALLETAFQDFQANLQAFPESVEVIAKLLSSSERVFSSTEIAKYANASIHLPCFETFILEKPSSAVACLQLLRWFYCHPAYTWEQDQVAVVKFLLSLYQMSLSEADQLLMTIFTHWEQTTSLASCTFKQLSFVYGKAIQNIDLDGESSLTQSFNWVFTDALDPVVMKTSIANFCFSRSFAGELDPENYNPEVYDPAFLLRLIGKMLTSSTNDIELIRKMIQQNLLSYCIVCCSSSQLNLREYAYGVIALFHQELQYENQSYFPERRQLLLVLESLKNGIPEPFERLPFLICWFLQSGITILRHPSHFLYPNVNMFLLSRNALDLGDIPLFYQLFTSSKPNADQGSRERAYILNLLVQGIQTRDDLELVNRRHVVSLLGSYYHSRIASEVEQLRILQLFQQISTLSSGLLELQEHLDWSGWIRIALMKALGPKKDFDRGNLPRLAQVLRMVQTGWTKATPEHQKAASMFLAEPLLLVLEAYFEHLRRQPKRRQHEQVLENFNTIIQPCCQVLQEIAALSRIQTLDYEKAFLWLKQLQEWKALEPQSMQCIIQIMYLITSQATQVKHVCLPVALRRVCQDLLEALKVQSFTCESVSIDPILNTVRSGLHLEDNNCEHSLSQCSK